MTVTGFDAVGKLNAGTLAHTLPKFKLNTFVNYENGPVNLRWSGRYYSSYLDQRQATTAVGYRINSQFLHDVALNVELLKDTTLTVAVRGQQPSLLTGILKDSDRRAMTPSHASKGKAQRYRYYVTRPDQTSDQPAYRVSAHDLEQIVITKLASYFAAPSNIASLAPADIEAHALQQALAKADLTAAALRSGSAKAKHAIITKVLSQAVLHEDQVELMLDRAGLAETLALTLEPSMPSITLRVPAQRQRRGHQVRLMIADEGQPIETITPPKPARDDKLIALLAEAHAARQLVLDDPKTPLAELARQQGKCRKHLGQLIELSCLAPDIVEAVGQPIWATGSGTMSRTWVGCGSRMTERNKSSVGLVLRSTSMVTMRAKSA